MQVRPNSIWFQSAAELARWQQVKKSGDSKALAAYQDEKLSQRDAWQFLNRLTVTILTYDSGKNQVELKMSTPGRMLGTTWWLDAGALRE